VLKVYEDDVDDKESNSLSLITTTSTCSGSDEGALSACSAFQRAAV